MTSGVSPAGAWPPCPRTPPRSAEDVPVALRLPARRDGLRQRVDEAVHVRRVEVVLLVPRRGREDDVGVERRRVHAEVQVDDQVDLPAGCLVPPHDVAHAVARQVLRHVVVVRAEVVVEEVLVPLGRGHQRVAAPDEPQPRPGALGVRILDGELQSRDFLSESTMWSTTSPSSLAPLSARLAHDIDRVLVELRVERQPAVLHRADVRVDRVPVGDAALGLVFGDAVVVPVALLVAPLVRVHVVPARGVLQARRRIPVLGERDVRPRLHRRQLLLADVVRQAAAVDAHAAAEHQRVHRGPVHQVGVVPVVDARADDDGALAAGVVGGRRPLTREADERLRGPCRCSAPPRRACRAESSS